MLINFYCFTSHVYYFRLEIYDKTIIEFSLWFSPLKMYNKTIIGHKQLLFIIHQIILVVYLTLCDQALKML